MRLAIVNQHSSAGGGARFVRTLITSLAAEYPDLEISLFADADNMERDQLMDLTRGLANVDVRPLGRPDRASAQATVVAETGAGAVPGKRTCIEAAWRSLPPGVRAVLKRATVMQWLYFAIRPRQQAGDDSWATLTLSPVTVQELEGYDVVHFAWPFFIEPVRLEVAATLVTAHDFNYKYGFGNFSDGLVGALERQLPGWLSSADVVTTSTEFIRSELDKFYPHAAAKADVVYLTHFGAKALPGHRASAIREGLGLPASYILCASNTSRHKNLERLIDACGILKRRGFDIPLVLAGAGTDNAVRLASNPLSSNHPLHGLAAIGDGIRRAGLRSGHDVFGLGYVTDEEINALIQDATLLVSPSVYEAGCGPAVDAWTLGTPVAFSDIPPFTEQLEVLGVEAWLFDPRDPESIAGVLEDAASDDAGRVDKARRSQESLLSRGPHEVARGYMGAYEAAIESRKRKKT